MVNGGVEVVHPNSVQLTGRVSKSGPKLQYASSGVPACTFVWEIDQWGKDDKLYTTYIPIEATCGTASSARSRRQDLRAHGQQTLGDGR
jgi:primosomal replication protein N